MNLNIIFTSIAKSQNKTFQKSMTAILNNFYWQYDKKHEQIVQKCCWLNVSDVRRMRGSDKIEEEKNIISF